MTDNNTNEKNNQDKKDKRAYTMKAERIENFKPPLYHIAKHITAGEFEMIKYSQNKVLTHVQKIDKDHYLNKRTGEIKEYQVMTDEAKAKIRKSTLNRTFEDLMNIIRANFIAFVTNQLFVTLTWRGADQTKDPKVVYKEFEKFIKRLKYVYKDQHEFEYIVVIEPHGSGCWHIHLLLKSMNQTMLYIPNQEMARIWRNGTTDTQRLKSDDVGNYYTSYFRGIIAETEYTKEELEGSDLENTGETILEAEQEAAKNNELLKKYIKGERLKFYPEHFKFYRCSKGIIRPEVVDDYVYFTEDKNLEKIYERGYAITKEWQEETPEHKKGSVNVVNKVYKATYRRRNKNDEQSCTYNDAVTLDNIVIQAKISIEKQLEQQVV